VPPYDGIEAGYPANVEKVGSSTAFARFGRRAFCCPVAVGSLFPERIVNLVPMLSEREKATLTRARDVRAESLRHLERYESGALRMGSNDGSGWKDITPALIEEMKRQVAVLDEIIDEWEQRDKA
jgi:hypothetical protein